MKKYFHAFFMAFGMFTAIPCPYRPWDDNARPYMILFFPVIGVLLGAIWMGCGYLAAFLGLPRLITAVVLTLLPYLLTGFLHLDGYMDVSDAILSRRDLPERQRILKDSHVGSFAVIMLAALFLTGFGVFASASEHTDFRLLLFLPAAVRANAGIAISVLRPMSTSQYSGNYRSSVRLSHILVLILLFLLSAVGGLLLCGWRGILTVFVGGAAYWLAAIWGYRNLDGMNGDISGFSLVLGELAGAATMILIGG